MQRIWEGDSPKWHREALCARSEYPNSWWFPTITDDDGVEWMDDGTIWEAYGDTSEHYVMARAVCSMCPVQDKCQQNALRTKERWGMWGGLTPIERRRIERKDRRDRRAALSVVAE